MVAETAVAYRIIKKPRLLGGAMKAGRRYAWLLLIGLFVLGGLGCSSRNYSPEGYTTTVILIRHTERTLVTKQLTEAGRARAAALPAALESIDITAIYSLDKARNVDTVKPLARQRGLEIIRVPADTDVTEITRRLISDHPGKTVLWVGNTTNLDRIYTDLGGTGEPPIVYGDLFILEVPDRGETRVIKRRFGA